MVKEMHIPYEAFLGGLHVSPKCEFQKQQVLPPPGWLNWRALVC